MLEFTRDESKRAYNLWKHKIDFVDAVRVFEGMMVYRIDDRRDYGEDRWQGIGMLRGILITIIFVDKSETVRLISARRSTKNEIKAYYKKVRH